MHNNACPTTNYRPRPEHDDDHQTPVWWACLLGLLIGLCFGMLIGRYCADRQEPESVSEHYYEP
jgi:hypothetical protein